MKSEDIDWAILRGALITFVLTIIVSSAMVYGVVYFKSQMQLEFNRSNAAFRSISSRYLAVDEEEKLIKSFLPRFVELFNSGVIGNEQRLNWIEVLRDTGDEVKLPSLSYQIDSQQVFTPGFPLDIGKYRLYSSKMVLTMSLMHEGDLFRILDILEEEAKGIFSLVNCSINPAAGEIATRPDASNINAKCELQWYTIRLADGTQIEV